MAAEIIGFIGENPEALKQGLQVGDVITHIDFSAIDSPETLEKTIAAKSGLIFSLQYTRNGSDLTARFETSDLGLKLKPFVPSAVLMSDNDKKITSVAGHKPINRAYLTLFIIHAWLMLAISSVSGVMLLNKYASIDLEGSGLPAFLLAQKYSGMTMAGGIILAGLGYFFLAKVVEGIYLTVADR
jgi:hypothetical protein